jgi:dTMP kinase
MKIVVIEGLDGAGKSTQIKLLTNYLAKEEIRYNYIHFPRTDTPYFGEMIARFLRGDFGSVNEVDPYLVSLLYAEDRNDAASQIREWLDQNHLVILDRYTYSNIAYQCAKLDDKAQKEKLRKWILDLEFNYFGIPVPDINIFLDVPFSFTEQKLKSNRAGEDRIYLNGLSDIHETDIGFQRRVREMYLNTASIDNRLTILECFGNDKRMLTPEKIFEKILNLLFMNKILL